MGGVRVPAQFARSIKVIAGLVTLALIVGACAELEQPEGFSASSSTSSVPRSEAQTDSQLVIRPGETDSSEQVAASAAVPTAAEDYIADLIISGEDRILQADSEGLTELIESPLSEFTVIKAVDDLGGGLVVQDANSSVIYLQSQREPEVLVDEQVALLDVGFWDGAPRAFVQLGETQIDWIQLVSERDGQARQRQNHINLAEGEKVVDFAASRDLQAVIVQDEQCGEIRFYNANGDQLDLLNTEAPECTFPGRPAFGAIDISPDGGAVVYTLVTYRDDGTEEATEVVAFELLTNASILGLKIGEDRDQVTSLTFDGERIAYKKISQASQTDEAADDSEASESGETVTILDIAPGSREIPVAPLGDGIQTVSFARIPLDIAT